MRFKKSLLLITSIVLVTLAIYLGENNSPSDRKILSPQSPANVALMADIHQDLANFKTALDLAKTDRVDFLIILGDLTTLGKINELQAIKNILDQSPLKYFVVPGNHDLYSGQKNKQDYFGRVFGRNYQSFLANQDKYILLDNADEENGIDDLQWAWLKKELTDCPTINCLVFLHEPLNHPSSGYIMGEANAEVASQTASLVNLLVDHQVKEVFTGHLHYSNHYLIDGLTTTIVGAITGNRNYQKPRFLKLSWPERKEVLLSP